MSNVMNVINDKISFRPVTGMKDDIIKIAPALRMILKKGETSIVVFRANDLILQYIENEREFLSIFSKINNDKKLDKIFIPVHINRCKDIDEQYRTIKEKLKNKDGANVIAIRKIGVFIWGETKTEADRLVSLFLDMVKIKKYSSVYKNIDFEEITKCLSAEYSSLIKGIQKDKKTLSEKIAIVTGAAQGFGKGIAEFLAGEGANVVLADLNLDMAEKNVLRLNEKYGRGKSLAVKADVTDEDYVRNMVWETVKEYGGIDILISNAGVLKAGGLDCMDLKSFEFSTKVNYTAFFICAKYASEPMKIQSYFDKDYFTDIIQINSKSGLEGSGRNFTYAGSKFGGIGLVQSFALELVEYNIKVNAICPGNYFEGPLWSDPKRGLFIQYLKSNKVPGAKTVKDVRKYYEEKVPMKRGCHINDITRAILYIIDQKYETGQAVPVTGGQVMLS